MWVCVYVCLFCCFNLGLFVNVISLEPFEVELLSRNFKGARHVVKRLDDFDNGCIPMHCGARVVVLRLWCSSFNFYCMLFAWSVEKLRQLTSLRHFMWNKLFFIVGFVHFLKFVVLAFRFVICVFILWYKIVFSLTSVPIGAVSGSRVLYPNFLLDSWKSHFRW